MKTWKPILLILSISLSIFVLQAQSKTPRIAICGIGIESSTFSPAKTDINAFTIYRGSENFKNYPFLAEGTPLRKSVEWIPLLRARALPGGIVTSRAYKQLSEELLHMLKENGPYDGIFFDIHGAMSVEEVEDPEGDLIQKIREIVGNQVLVSTSMDLHGNVSKRLAKNSDLITCYRMAPHEDALESKQRAVQNLIDRLQSGLNKPKFKAYVKVPILLPGEKTSTRVEPAKSLYGEIPRLTEHDGVIDAAIWMGYPWADEPRNHAVVMAVGDDKDQAEKVATRLAQQMWKVRNQFDFVAPTTTLDSALITAIKSENSPFFISDMGDNPTAGGAGDVTWTLEKILAYPHFQKLDAPSVVYASIPGPELIDAIEEFEIGEIVSGEVGASVDNRYAPPVKLTGKLIAKKYGDKNADVEAVIQINNIKVIVTKRRKPYHYVHDFTDLGIDLFETDIVIVKIGYLVPELYNTQKGWLMALTPGGVDQDLQRLKYERIQRPMYPLDEFLKDPNLTVEFIPLSDQSE